jgi:hypothetical protein
LAYLESTNGCKTCNIPLEAGDVIFACYYDSTGTGNLVLRSHGFVWAALVDIPHQIPVFFTNVGVDTSRIFLTGQEDGK